VEIDARPPENSVILVLERLGANLLARSHTKTSPAAGLLVRLVLPPFATTLLMPNRMAFTQSRTEYVRVFQCEDLTPSVKSGALVIHLIRLFDISDIEYVGTSHCVCICEMVINSSGVVIFVSDLLTRKEKASRS